MPLQCFVAVILFVLKYSSTITVSAAGTTKAHGSKVQLSSELSLKQPLAIRTINIQPARILFICFFILMIFPKKDYLCFEKIINFDKVHFRWMMTSKGH